MTSFRLTPPAGAGRTTVFVALVLAVFTAPFAVDLRSAPIVRSDAAQLRRPIFRETETASQWRAASLIGVAVFDIDGRRAGNVEDVLMSPDGRARTVVIGVGGLLGLGARTIAVAFDDIRWEAGAGGLETSRTSGGNSAAGNFPETPDKAFVGATTAELQAAPEFRYADARRVPDIEGFPASP